LQAVGDLIVMDANATSVLQRKEVGATDDSYKYIWNKVSLLKIIKALAFDHQSGLPL